MKDFWNSRYASAEFAYGKEPNTFLRESLTSLAPGKILFPGDGEGRNSVYAASLGWDVVAFDSSFEGMNKARRLAEEQRLHVDYHVADYESFSWEPEDFDCLVLIFTHMPVAVRKAHHSRFLQWLKPGGTVLLEGFSKEQLGKTTGGPKDLSMLFSKEELEDDFRILSEINIIELNTHLDEGPFHRGLASVIRLTGKK